jgi:hypothetical protein
VTNDVSSAAGKYAVGQDVSPLPVRDERTTSVVAAPSPRTRTWRIAALGFVVVVGLALLLVSARLDFLRATYDLAAEERTAERLLEERRHLVVERASLRSPARLAIEASLRSTLQRADADQWVRWPELGRADRWPW